MQLTSLCLIYSSIIFSSFNLYTVKYWFAYFMFYCSLTYFRFTLCFSYNKLSYFAAYVCFVQLLTRYFVFCNWGIYLSKIIRFYVVFRLYLLILKLLYSFSLTKSSTLKIFYQNAKGLRTKTNIFAKVFERIVYNQVYSALSSGFRPEQHGFLKKPFYNN